MAEYKIHNGPDGQPIGYLRTADNAAIFPGGKGYQEAQDWIGAGNTPDPADPLPIVYGRTTDVNQRKRTADGSVSEIARWTLASLTGYRAKLELLAVDAGNGAVKYIEATIVAKRLGAGAVLVGSPAVVVNLADAAASTWAVSAVASVNDVVISVTGAAGRTIDWQVQGFVRSFSPAGES